MVALARFVVVALWDRSTGKSVPVRLALGRFLGLEFQLASGILRTATVPTLREVAVSVAAIRTALTFLLAREIRQERRELVQAGHHPHTDSNHTQVERLA